MKIILLLAFLIFTTTLLAQKDSNKFYVGIVFSPDYCYRTLSLNGSNDVQLIIDQNNDREVPKFSMTTGVSVLWRMSRNFELSAGILYSNKGYQTRKMSFGNPMNSIDHVKFKYNFHCIDVPLGVNFIAGKKRLQFASSLTATGNIFLFKTIKTYSYTGNESGHVSGKSNYDYRRIWFTAEIGAGVKYDINSRFQARLIPCFRYGVTKINDTPIAGQLWNVGLNICGYYRL